MNNVGRRVAGFFGNNRGRGGRAAPRNSKYKQKNKGRLSKSNQLLKQKKNRKKQKKSRRDKSKKKQAHYRRKRNKANNKLILDQHYTQVK